MLDALLITHYFALAIGAGTPFYMGALASHAAKSGDPAKIKETMLGAGGAVATIGSVGLVILLISGILLASLYYSSSLGWAFYTKIVLVLAIVVYVAGMKLLSKKAKNEEGMKTMGTIKKLAPIGPVLSVLVIVFAVLAFH